jgi:ribonuclease P protein component
MLAAQHRMRSSRDFHVVRRNGKKVVTPGLVMHIYTALNDGSPALVGLTVGKDCGNSVQRHRISRQIRGAMAPILSQLPAGSGVVVKALPHIHEVKLDSDLMSGALRHKLPKHNKITQVGTVNR